MIIIEHVTKQHITNRVLVHVPQLLVFTIFALSAGFLLTKNQYWKTGNQNPPDLKGQGSSGYLFFQY